eukprot:scaffold96328_cov66-Phaeocystis_antarctica.AAC.4
MWRLLSTYRDYASALGIRHEARRGALRYTILLCGYLVFATELAEEPGATRGGDILGAALGAPRPALPPPPRRSALAWPSSSSSAYGSSSLAQLHHRLRTALNIRMHPRRAHLCSTPALCGCAARPKIRLSGSMRPSPHPQAGRGKRRRARAAHAACGGGGEMGTTP